MKKQETALQAYEQWAKARKSLIGKIKPIIKQGHMPCRGKMPYPVYFEELNKNVNCFEAAFLNFTNSQLLKINIDFVESLVLGGQYAWARAETTDEMECDIAEFLEDCGLQVSECPQNAILKNNQWKVALFLSTQWQTTGSYHCLLQEKDGSWSAKDGFSGKEHFYDKLEERIRCCDDVFDFLKTFAVTNPYVKEK